MNLLFWTFEPESVDILRAWDAIFSHLVKFNGEQTKVRLQGVALPAKEVRAALRPESSRYVETHNWADAMNAAARGEMYKGEEWTVHWFKTARDYSAIRFCSPPGSLGDLEALIEHVATAGLFLQGGILDYVYDYWQNAEDPLHYEHAGKSYAELPMRTNGLLYPLTQDIIDIRSNPGRSPLADGYNEFVSSPMWLSKAFLSRRQASATSIPSGYSHEWRGENLKVWCDYRPFATDDERQSALQNALRRWLYRAVETPRLN